ncbi:MAG: class I SAM-dependent methyltransferase [Alphaproteobacteria bacterium]|nr:class I SAM-dependent methyltransferase [Alphaproteobacteria bacterium]
MNELIPMQSKEKQLAYWTNPCSKNNPLNYLVGKRGRSELIAKTALKYLSSNATILELGCNVGRNLNYLRYVGFKHLTSIEINLKAIEVLKQVYLELADIVTIHSGAIEDNIKSFKDNQFDMTLAVAVLMHLVPESEWVFDEMVRITKQYIFCLDEELLSSITRKPRNYQEVFESRGMKQIEVVDCKTIDDLTEGYHFRVFEKCQK